MPRFKAILFDFDGVLVDTEMLHADAWLNTLKPRKISFTEEEFRKDYLGKKDHDFLDSVADDYQTEFSKDEREGFIGEKVQRYVRSIQQKVPIYPKVEETLSKVSQTHQLALVTGSNRREVEHIFQLRGWEKYFQFVIAAQDVKIGKPSPEGYLKAVEFLKLEKKDCLVVEDSPRGIQAAKAAGLYCIGVTNNFKAEEIPQADEHITSLDQLIKIV